MAYTDLEAARRHRAALQSLIARHPGGAADLRALRRAVDLCRGAAEAVDDAYCHEKIRLAAEYAAELFAHSERMHGADYLKRQALAMLELFESRLYSLALNARSL
jgi:hypothetical protein